MSQSRRRLSISRSVSRYIRVSCSISRFDFAVTGKWDKLYINPRRLNDSTIAIASARLGPVVYLFSSTSVSIRRRMRFCEHVAIYLWYVGSTNTRRNPTDESRVRLITNKQLNTLLVQ